MSVKAFLAQNVGAIAGGIFALSDLFDALSINSTIASTDNGFLNVILKITNLTVGGLDTFTTFEPLRTVGNMTLLGEIAMERLDFYAHMEVTVWTVTDVQCELTAPCLPSACCGNGAEPNTVGARSADGVGNYHRLDNALRQLYRSEWCGVTAKRATAGWCAPGSTGEDQAYKSGMSRVRENVVITTGLSDLAVKFAGLLAIDQLKLDRLKLGSLVESPLHCLVSSIYRASKWAAWALSTVRLAMACLSRRRRRRRSEI